MLHTPGEQTEQKFRSEQTPKKVQIGGGKRVNIPRAVATTRSSSVDIVDSVVDPVRPTSYRGAAENDIPATIPFRSRGFPSVYTPPGAPTSEHPTTEEIAVAAESAKKQLAQYRGMSESMLNTPILISASQRTERKEPSRLSGEKPAGMRRRRSLVEVAKDVTNNIVAKTKRDQPRDKLLIAEALRGCPSVPIMPLDACPPCDYCLYFPRRDSYSLLGNAANSLGRLCLEKRGKEGMYAILTKSVLKVTDSRCFDLQVVLIPSGGLSLHITVRPDVAPHLYQYEITRQNALLVGGIDLPYPESETDLSDAQRTRILYGILHEHLYSKLEAALAAGAMLFPVHCREKRDLIWEKHCASLQWRRIFSDMPEDAICTYFGEQCMFYFAWMNHYQKWLMGGSALGVAVTASGLVWGCSLEDNPFLPLFSVILTVGGVLCTKMWERRFNTLCMRYHIFHGQTKDERRPTFRGVPGTNPVTGEAELQYPAWRRAAVLQPFSWVVISFFIGIVLLIDVCLLNLKGMTPENSVCTVQWLRRLSQPGGLFDHTSFIYGNIPAVMDAVCIATLSGLFRSLAAALTNMENYRYRGEYIRSFTQKRVVLEFVNSYGSLLFIAFGRRSMNELSSNLQSLLLVAALSRVFSETVVPFVITHRKRMMKRVFSRKRSEVKKAAALKVTRAQKAAGGTSVGRSNSTLDEVDERLDGYELYADYIQMAIQLGYIVIFAIAFPLASLVALVSNIVEVRSDLFKMCYVVRRPIPRMGVMESRAWCGIFRAFALFGVATNAFLFVFTSKHGARWWWRLSSAAPSTTAGGTVKDPASPSPLYYAVVLEHAVLAISLLLLWRVNSVPKAVRVYEERKNYLRVQAAQV